MSHRTAKLSAFSLLEVVLAVAVFAVAVSALLGLLPALARQSVVSTATLSALRLPDALRMELRRLALTGGFDALAAQTKPLAMPLPETCLLVATNDAARVQSLDYQPPPTPDRIAEDAQYFLIEVWRFRNAPLAFDPNGAVLPLHLRVSWPYRLPGSGAGTPLEGREQVSFNLVLLR